MHGENNGHDRSSVRRRTFLKTAAASTAAVTTTAGCLSSLSGGGEYPSENIEVIVPFSAGGGTDQSTRKLVDISNSKKDFDSSFFVSNVTGATGSNGMQQVANSDPDGYTVAAETLEIVVFEHLGISQLEPKDLQAVMQYSSLPASLNVLEDAPYNNLEEFVAYAKDNPGEIRIANAGTGSFWHLGAAGFALNQDIEVKHVPYDGGAPAIKGLLNGEVEVAAVSPPEIAPQVNDGPVTSLGVMAEERAEPIPDTPTFKEEGYDWTMSATFSLAVPPETPQERIDVLHDTAKAAFDTDEFQQFMTQKGFTPTYRTGEEYMDFKDKMHKQSGEIISELGLGN